MPCRFALLQGDSPDVTAWLAQKRPDSVLAGRGAALGVWGQWFESSDGRTAGAFDGYLLNPQPLRQRLSDRGYPADRMDHQQLALQWLADFGPRGLGDLRWHGSLCVWHRAQHAALVARDVGGVGWLGRSAIAGGGWAWCSDPRLDGEQVRAAPAGMGAILQGGQLSQPRWQPAAENAPFYREIPAEARHASPKLAADRARALLQAAVAAVREGLGATAAPDRNLGIAAGSADADSDGAIWCGAGWHAENPQAAATDPALRDDGPHEPIDDADTAEAAARRYRWRALGNGTLRQARILALDSGRPLCAPHLDPALLAWLGALAKPVRDSLLGR